MQRIALVTGGTGGIGTAICRVLADKGYKVYANHLGEVEKNIAWQAELKEQGYNFDIIEADVTEIASVQSMIDSIIGREKRIDILVNAAGITRDKVFKKMDPIDWQSVINVNLVGVFNVTNLVNKIMLEQGWGRIINISSVNGRKGQFGQTNYSAAKAGIHGFTKALAQETARKGVTVNTIAPGYTDTEMVRAIPSDVLEKIIADIPAGRLAKPEEIAHAVAFLCDDYSSYITGAELAVNGGMYMY